MKRYQWALCLMVMGILMGCGASGPTEASAEAKLSAELDKWMADEDSDAATFESARYAPPISYSIRSVTPTEPSAFLEDLGDIPYESVDKNAPAFRIVVDVDFRSEADTEVKKVVEYTLTWVEQLNDWLIDEEI